MSQDARRDEEQNTQRRAQILGLPYVDTSQLPNRQLYVQFLSVPELRNMRVIPLSVVQNSVTFGITNNTSQQTMRNLQQQFADFKVSFCLISDTGFEDYMKLYDPPKQVVYENIDISSAGTDDLITRVAEMLRQIRPDDMLAYLVEQAHNVEASDIHLEPQKSAVRVRFRIDGVLHPIGTLDPDRYRLLLGVIASAGNISSASKDAQQGHISQVVRMANGSEVNVNVRLETVPTVNGTEVVMRLFNMEQSRYTLDRLGLAPEERAVLMILSQNPADWC
jgi:type IV pilus assembly protein PilB